MEVTRSLKILCITAVCTRRCALLRSVIEVVAVKKLSLELTYRKTKRRLNVCSQTLQQRFSRVTLLSIPERQSTAMLTARLYGIMSLYVEFPYSRAMDQLQEIRLYWSAHYPSCALSQWYICKKERKKDNAGRRGLRNSHWPQRPGLHRGSTGIREDRAV